MKKAIFGIVIIAFGFLSIHAQLSVAIVADSPTTIINQIQSVMQGIQTVSNTLETVKGISSMIQTQIKSLESLSTGTFDGLVQAWDYQVDTLGNFTSVLNGLDALPGLQNIADDPGFQDFKTSSGLLSKSMKQSSNLLHATQTTVKNAELRAQSFKSIQAASQSTQSTVAQLSLTNQAIGLVQGQLADVNSNLVAANASIQTQQDVEKAETAMIQKRRDDFIKTKDGDSKLWSGSYTEQEAHKSYKGPIDPDATVY